MMARMDERYIRPEAAAERLGVTTMTLRRWAKAGKIRHRTLPSGQRRYSETDVERYEAEANPEPP